MRPAASGRNEQHVTRKATADKMGALVKAPIKKIYCGRCQKLVGTKTLGTGNAMRITCSKCGQPLWAWTSTVWKYAGKEAGGA